MTLMKFQTVERDSFLTRVDFRSKITLMVTITILEFVWESLLVNAIMALIVLLACVVSGVKIKFIRQVLLVMLPFYVLILLTHGFFNVNQVMVLTGKEELTRMFILPPHWWLVGGAGMTWEGFLYGLSIIFKTMTITLVVPLVIFTSDVDNMVVGMVRARIPYKLAFIFSSTLRFFPLLFTESSTIIEAQRLRGLAIEKMGPLERVRVYARITIPLILGAMVKSQQLEVVLQSKAFSGDPNRTYLHESVLQPADFALITGSVVFFLIALGVYIAFGIGKFGWPF